MYLLAFLYKTVEKCNERMIKVAKQKRNHPPSMDPDTREAQLINKAMNQAEKQIEKGTASSQIITHFLRLGTEQARLEREKIRAEVALANAKIEAIKSQQTSEELYQKAIEAFTSYQISPYDGGDYDEYDDDY